MCIPVNPKNVAANCGTVLLTSANSLFVSAPGTGGNTGSVKPSEIRWFHSRPWRITNAIPQAMVASSHPCTAFMFPNTDARTANTMVNELVSKNAVINVALTMLLEWKGVGQFGVEMRP